MIPTLMNLESAFVYGVMGKVEWIMLISKLRSERKLVSEESKTRREVKEDKVADLAKEL